LSFPHARHDAAPGGEYLPLLHFVCALVPSHENPAAHEMHAERVVMLPPDVDIPGGHDKHVLVPTTLYLESEPHRVHTTLPLPLK